MSSSSSSRLSQQQRKAAFKVRLQALLQQTQNQRCSECDEPRPTWAGLVKLQQETTGSSSTSNDARLMGVFCCFSCSTHLHKLGPDLCTVKSVKMMDDWTAEQVVAMELGGNTTMNRIYEATLDEAEYDRVKDPELDKVARLQFLRNKYSTRTYFDGEQYQCWLLQVQQRQAQLQYMTTARTAPSTSSSTLLLPQQHPQFNASNTSTDVSMRQPTRQPSVSQFDTSEHSTCTNSETTGGCLLDDDVSSLGASSHVTDSSNHSYQPLPPKPQDLGYDDNELGYGQDQDYTTGGGTMNNDNDTAIGDDEDTVSVSSSCSSRSYASERSSLSASSKAPSSLDLDLGYQQDVLVKDNDDDDDEPRRSRISDDSLQLIDLGYGNTSNTIDTPLGFAKPRSRHEMPSAPELGYEWEPPPTGPTTIPSPADLGYGDDRQSAPPKPAQRVRAARMAHSRCSMPTLGEASEHIRAQAAPCNTRRMPRRTSSCEGPAMFRSKDQQQQPQPRMRRASMSSSLDKSNLKPLAPLPAGIMKPATRRMRRLSISLRNDSDQHLMKNDASNPPLMGGGNGGGTIGVPGGNNSINNNFNDIVVDTKPVYVGQEPIMKKTRRMLRRSSTTSNSDGSNKKTSYKKRMARRSSTGGAPSNWKVHCNDLMNASPSVSRWLGSEPIVSRRKSTGVAAGSCGSDGPSREALAYIRDFNESPRRSPGDRSSRRAAADQAPRIVRRASTGDSLVMPVRRGSNRGYENNEDNEDNENHEDTARGEEYEEPVLQQDAPPVPPRRQRCSTCMPVKPSRSRDSSLDPVEEGDESKHRGPPRRGCRFHPRGSTEMPTGPRRSSSWTEPGMDTSSSSSSGLFPAKSMTWIEVRQRETSPRNSSSNIYTHSGTKAHDKIYRATNQVIPQGVLPTSTSDVVKQQVNDVLFFVVVLYWLFSFVLVALLHRDDECQERRKHNTSIQDYDIPVSMSRSPDHEDNPADNPAQSPLPSTFCNFIVMSDAGKPIFARCGNAAEIARSCGLLQAMRMSISSDPSLGEVQSLRSGKSCLVFMSVGSISLVAIGDELATEAYLRLQLEYIFSQIMFSVTEQIQETFSWNPSFDLGNMLGSTEGIIQDILDDSSGRNPGPYFIGGIESVFPISPDLRSNVSRTLQVVGLQTEFTIFALLIAGDKILSIVQPIYLPHQIRATDLQLLVKFVSRQPGLLTSENWIPVCLPRFASADFLFCYTHCLDVETKLCLVLVSQQSTTEQFMLFRTAAAKIRRSLGLPNTTETVLEIIESNITKREMITTDVLWRRSSDENLDSEDDYVDASGDGDKLIPYDLGCRDDLPLLRALKGASDPDNVQKIFDEYLQIGSVLHFVFRFDAPIRSFSPVAGGHVTGRFTQCLSNPMNDPFFDESTRQRVWSMYQKLNLRLRLGSASVESTMDAFDMISLRQETTIKNDDFITSGIGKHCPAMCLAGCPANVDGVAFVLNRNELFFAINGRDFELYTYFASPISLKEATALGAKLARRLLAEQSSLFLASPLTWEG